MKRKPPFISLLLDIWHLLVGGQQCGVQDRIGMKIAARHGWVKEYKKARRQNMRVLEVLDNGFDKMCNTECPCSE